MSAVQKPGSWSSANDSMEVPRFELWRQDDNANEFLVQTFSCRQEAMQKMGRLALGGHKQLYWIKSRWC